MRIAQLVNNLEIGGAERMLVDLSVSLKLRGHSVDVVCLRGAGPLAQPLQAAGIDVTSFGKGSGFTWSVVRQLARFLKSRQIDVVHTHNPLVHHYGVIGGRLARVPVIVNSLHGFGNLDDSRKTRTIFDLSCLFSNQVVSVCGALDSHLQKVTVLAGRHSTVIPNGIDLEPYLAVSPRSLREPFVFGAVGRLAPVKDHKTLLLAFDLVRKAHSAVRLEIVGDGPLRSELQELSSQLGLDDLVTIHQATSDVPRFLSGINVFVLPSRTEGLPLTLIEAMASGLPVVASTVGGVPELVRGGECGWLAAAGDPESLASSMVAAMESPDSVQMGFRGRRYAAQHLSGKSMTDGYEQLFARLLKDAAQRSSASGLERKHLAGLN